MITQIQAKKSYEAPYLDIVKMESDMLMKHFSWVYDGHGGTHEISDEDDWEGMSNEYLWYDDFPEE